MTPKKAKIRKHLQNIRKQRKLAFRQQLQLFPLRIFFSSTRNHFLRKADFLWKHCDGLLAYTHKTDFFSQLIQAKADFDKIHTKKLCSSEKRKKY